MCRTKLVGDHSLQKGLRLQEVIGLINHLHWWPYLYSTHHQVSVRLSSNTASYSLVTPASTIHCRNEYLILPTKYHYSSKTSNSSVGDWSESLASRSIELLRPELFFPLSKWSCMHMTSSLITCRLVVTNPSCSISYPTLSYSQPPAPLNQQHRSD